MCLEKISERKIAKNDILCYKMLKRENFSEIKSGKVGESYILVFDDGGEIEGKLIRRRPLEFKITTFYNIDKSSVAISSFIKGRYFHLAFIRGKNGEVIKVNNNHVFRTFFRGSLVKIGNTYTSEIEIYKSTISKALHSYCYKKDAIIKHSEVLVKCIIPKGSVYYRGMFDNVPSYASNQLKYVEIIANK